MVKLSLSLLLWSTVWISTESSTSCVNLKRFNFTNCDKDDLRTEELTHVLHKAARIISYETSTQCNDPTHCSNDSPGTGHTLASGENGGPSVQNTISVERCYSYCLKFANLLVSAMCYCWYLNAYRFSNLSQKGTDFLCILRGIVFPLSLCTG